MSHTDHCRVEREGGVLLITLNRPDRLNALDRKANQALGRIFDDFEKDPLLRVAILTGAGTRAFCAGNDLRQTLEGTDPGWPPTGFGGLTARFNRDKPVIAAVNGVAAGGGFELALACDLIVASSTAQFCLPETRVGLAAVAGGLQMLTRQIPLKQAMGLILTGRSVGADEGFRCGFVNEVVEPAELMSCARRWADQILRCAPLGVCASMQGIRAGQGLSLQEAQIAQDACEAVQRVKCSADRLEGARAFAEKRDPVWEGR